MPDYRGVPTFVFRSRDQRCSIARTGIIKLLAGMLDKHGFNLTSISVPSCGLWSSDVQRFTSDNNGGLGASYPLVVKPVHTCFCAASSLTAFIHPVQHDAPGLPPAIHGPDKTERAREQTLTRIPFLSGNTWTTITKRGPIVGRMANGRLRVTKLMRKLRRTRVFETNVRDTNNSRCTLG